MASSTIVVRTIPCFAPVMGGDMYIPRHPTARDRSTARATRRRHGVADSRPPAVHHQRRMGFGARPAVPQARADKLIDRVVQPLPRHYNGQGCDGPARTCRRPGSAVWPALLSRFYFLSVARHRLICSQGCQAERIRATHRQCVHGHLCRALGRARRLWHVEIA